LYEKERRRKGWGQGLKEGGRERTTTERLLLEEIVFLVCLLL
jgi:hypothetical protein